MTEEQLRELLNDMSLDEKIGQLLQLTGAFYEDEGLATGPMEDMKLNEMQVDYAGSILSTVGAKKLRTIQDKQMKKQPHGIPMMFMADVINGYRTVFPIPLAQGCSFNPELVENMAAISAKESARAGIHVTFSPMVDLVRDARWGRVMESTGEDVYLNGVMAAATVKGYQGQDIASKDKISSCIKHFAAYSAPMGGRDYNQVELSERTLREEYLPGYKSAIDAGSPMVMTSFNTLGKLPCTANKKLMKELLRDEWGFDGVLISDWAAIAELMNHSVAENPDEAARLAIEAGVDIDMVTNVYTNHLKKLVEDKVVSEELINESVYRILALKNKLGLFENPYKGADEAYDEMEAPDKEHLTFARKAIAETFVLLKNDGILPFPKKATSDYKKIAFIGPYVDDNNVCGSWSLFYNIDENVTIDAALKEMNLDIEYVTAKGCTTMYPGQRLAGFKGPVGNDIGADEYEALVKDAIEKAASSDVVVMALGEHNQFTGEGGSRADITIPDHQLELFRKIYEVNKNIVVVNFSGRPLDIREVNDKARAFLQVWFPGTETGHAVTDVLFGDSNPGGRLSMCFPYSVGQVPVYYSELKTGRTNVGADNRFCSRYIDIPNEPLYAFGYGLDYTTYSYDNLSISNDRITDADTITVSVDVTNTGKRNGTEVVQMYICDVTGTVARPKRELKGFKKITLEAGETKRVSFDITVNDLRFYDVNMNYVAEPGKFEVYVGSDSATRNKVEFVY